MKTRIENDRHLFIAAGVLAASAVVVERLLTILGR